MQTFYKTTTTKDFNNWLPTQNPSSCQVFANPLANWVFIESATIAFFFLFVFELTLYIPKCPRLLYRENENDDISYEWLKMHDIGLCVWFHVYFTHSYSVRSNVPNISNHFEQIINKLMRIYSSVNKKNGSECQCNSTRCSWPFGPIYATLLMTLMSIKFRSFSWLWIN